MSQSPHFWSHQTAGSGPQCASLSPAVCALPIINSTRARREEQKKKHYFLVVVVSSFFFFFNFCMLDLISNETKREKKICISCWAILALLQIIFYFIYIFLFSFNEYIRGFVKQVDSNFYSSR